MNALRDRLAALVSAAPNDATVPVRWLGELLALDESDDDVGDDASNADHADDAGDAGDGRVDLTVKQLAERFGRGDSTIRSWLAMGALPGAYRLHGREWRIPISAVTDMQRTEAARSRTRTASSETRRSSMPDTPNLGEWRRHLPTRAATRSRDRVS